MNIPVHVVHLSPGRLALAMFMALSAGSANAISFESESGEVKGSFDTTLSAGAAWRMQDRDPSLIGITNGGTSRSVLEDDGNLNYNKGGVIYSAIKASHDFVLDYRNYGMFLRGVYFFDPVNDTRNFLGPEARDRMVSDAEMLDAYVRGSFDVGGRNLNARAGSQVVSWGESTFIPNGVNVINPVDVTKLRVPGAEIKEGLIPTNMLWLSQEAAQNSAVELVVLANFDKTRIDPRGSFFSTNDYVSDDGDVAYTGFGRRKDQHYPLVSPLISDGQAWIPRAPDRMPSDHGQFGVALRHFMPELGNTEFGIYYLNYHSRVPLISGIRGSSSSLLAAGTARYFVEYPENIHLYGASVNTQGAGGIAWQGEYSYRPNQPLQLAAIEVLLAGLGVTPNNVTGTTVLPVGTEITGYRRVRMHQAQVSGTKAFSQALGSDQMVLVGEVGYTYLDLPDGVLFNGPGTHLPSPESSTTTSGGSSQPGGYVTRNSWGYRLVMRWDYSNAIGAATLSPRLAFSHDVDGVSPTFNDSTKAATVGIGLNYKQNWQADISYTGFFGGRTFSGTDTSGVPAGQSADYASSSNPLKDRDFLAVSVSYSF